MFSGISTGIRTCNPWPVNSNRGGFQGLGALGEDGDSAAGPGSPRPAISEAARCASANQSTVGAAAGPWCSVGVLVAVLGIAALGGNCCRRSLGGRCGSRGVSGGGGGKRGWELRKKRVVGTS